MKLIKNSLMLGLGLIGLFIELVPSAMPLSLKSTKDSNWSLKTEFIKELVQKFKPDIFVETGTYVGGTTANALPYFKEIHTIELAPALYLAAVERFKNNPNIHLYLGDSAEVFSTILPTLEGKILFWLDGHYSEGATAQGKKNSPIIEELREIKKSNIKDAVILIDDIRCFKPFEYEPAYDTLKGYPTINEVKAEILEINNTYRFIIFGDTAIAFLKEEDVEISPLLKACTLSRLYNNADADYAKTLKAEKIIAKTASSEREELKKLYNTFSTHDVWGLSSHYRLWYALLLQEEGRYDEARVIFNVISIIAPEDKRIVSYLKS